MNASAMDLLDEDVQMDVWAGGPRFAVRVRLTHLPTGLFVEKDSDDDLPSQLRAAALKELARLVAVAPPRPRP